MSEQLKDIKPIAWVINKNDGTKVFVPSPLTDETFIDYGEEAVALVEYEKLSSLQQRNEELDQEVHDLETKLNFIHADHEQTVGIKERLSDEKSELQSRIAKMVEVARENRQEGYDSSDHFDALLEIITIGEGK